MKLAAGLLLCSTAFLAGVAALGFGGVRSAATAVGLCLAGFVAGEATAALTRRSIPQVGESGESLVAGFVRMAALLVGVSAWLASGAEFGLATALWIVVLYTGLLILDVGVRVGRLSDAQQLGVQRVGAQ